MAQEQDNQPGSPAGQPVDPLTLFEILARENADSLTAFLRAAVSDGASADDLFQETMLVAWRKIGQYDRSRPFGAWLRGIARRLVLAHWRQSAREVATPDERVLDYLNVRMAQVDRQSGDALDDRIEALTDCIRRLDPMYRQVVEMYYRQHRTCEWIAQALVATGEAVQKRLQRARAHLARCLEAKGVLSRLEQAK